jgi:hypothetical protein
MSRHGKRAEGSTAVTISLPKKLLAEVDEAAAEDRRTRSNWIVVQLEEAVRLRKLKKRGASGAAPVEPPKSSRSMRYPHGEDHEPVALAAEEPPKPRATKPTKH